MSSLPDALVSEFIAAAAIFDALRQSEDQRENILAVLAQFGIKESAH
jgi:hypothetical protein